MLRTISIQTALTLMGGFSIIAVLVIAGVGAFAFYEAAGGLAVEVNVGQAIRHEMEVDMFHEGVEASVLRALMIGPEGQPRDTEEVKRMLDEAILGYETAFAALEKSDLPAVIMAQVAAAKPLSERYLETARKTAAVGMKDRAQGMAQLSDFMASFNTLEQELGQLGDLLEKFGTGIETGIVATDHFYALLLGLSSLTVVSIMVATSWKFTRNIVKPITRLRAALDQVANGAFGLRIGVITRNDDIGAIARDIDRVSERVVTVMAEQKLRQDEADQVISRLGTELRALAAGTLTAQINETFTGTYDQLRQDFNQAARQLRQSISQVVDVSDSIRAQSSDLSRASENLANRTENQAATLEETAAALEQVTGSMTSAAQSARDVETVVQRARSEVEHSGTIVLGAVTAMHEIEASSAQISQIIGVIDDIAFQTNLLALNAGVEAARAGDAGRGFAVVASEVRALAQRSSLAAKEIKGLISASASQVERGVQQVDQARSALTAVVAEVARISDLVSNIARGSGEQARALHEINLGVAQLDQVTQQNAAMAEESGAACRAVEDEAIGLDKIVGQFDTGDKRGGKRRNAGPMAA